MMNRRGNLKVATSTTGCPLSITCLTASDLNSAEYLVRSICMAPLQFWHHYLSTDLGECQPWRIFATVRQP